MADEHTNAQSHLYSLLVGINEYDHEDISDLNGCLNDVEAIEAYLKQFTDNSPSINWKNRKLIEKEHVTKKAIIENFQTFFKEAKDKDICLFYFSGHGGRVKAPEAFWTEGDHKMEALVCREVEGNDSLLYDKELSYLIFKAVEDKDLHFVVITDSCHSGDNTKDSQVKVRSIPEDINTVEIDKLLGRPEYLETKLEDDSLRLNAPVGPHFKLSACIAHELSKERKLGSPPEVRGAFTFALLEILKLSGGGLSYSNLMSKTRFKTKLLAKDQSPKLELVKLPPQEKERLFLKGALANQKSTFQVNKDHEGMWRLQAGSAYGVSVGDEVKLDDEIETTVTEAHPFHSFIDFAKLTFTPGDKIFNATVSFSTNKKLRLTFEEGFDETIRANFDETIKEFKTKLLEIGDFESADFIIRTDDKSLFVTHPDNRVPIFARVSGTNRTRVSALITQANFVAEWYRVINMTNPKSGISEKFVKPQLSKVEKGYKFENPDAAKAVVIPNDSTEFVFRYHFDEDHPRGPWHPPAFRLQITNLHPQKDYWVSGLYCGLGFTANEEGTEYISTAYAITNQFMASQKISKGEKAMMIDSFVDIDMRFDYQSIELSLMDDYFDQGNNEIKDIIKVFVSSEALDLNAFEMPGIEIDTAYDPAGSKPSGRRPKLGPDWRTFDFPITIVQPRDLKRIVPDKTISFFGYEIKPHPGFSARVIISTLEEFIRSTARKDEESIKYHPKPAIQFGNENVQTHYLTSGMGDVDGCAVIEFFRAKGEQNLSTENPLIISVPVNLELKEGYRLCLATYSSSLKNYIYLSTLDKDRLFKLSSFQVENTYSPIEGLGNSVKLLMLWVKDGFELPKIKGLEES